MSVGGLSRTTRNQAMASTRSHQQRKRNDRLPAGPRGMTERADAKGFNAFSRAIQK